MATIEAIQINPDSKAVVIINEKTGTIVIGERVKISKVAVAHGNISLKVGAGGASSGAGSTSGGSDSKKKDSDEKIAVLDSGVSVGDLVQSLNRLGVSPKDLITILQSVRRLELCTGNWRFYKYMYRNKTQSHKLKMLIRFFTQSPGRTLSAGRVKGSNHGRSRVIGFFAGNRIKSQLSPRIGGTGLRREVKCRMHRIF